MKHFLILIISISLLSCQKEKDKNKDTDLSDPELYAYFPLDSNFNDLSGSENHLQAFGTPEFSEGYSADTSMALLFDGYDDYLTGYIGKLDTFSISMWLESHRYFVGEWPVYKSTVFDYSEKQAFGGVDGVSGATQLNFGVNSEEIPGKEIGNGEWVHLYVAIGNEIKIYLNGSLEKTELLDELPVYLNDSIYIGRASSDAELDLTFFQGKIDEVRIFNRILSQDEINELAMKK